MRVWLPLPPTWPLVSRRDRLVAVVPGHVDAPDLSVEILPLVPVPESPETFVRRALLEDSAGPVTVVDSSDTRTDLGWPLRLIHAVVGETGAPAIEQRLLALYGFLDFTGIVLVRGADLARYEAHRAELLAILGRARPEFTTLDPIAIAELYR
jgi:hypothetical protein